MYWILFQEREKNESRESATCQLLLSEGPSLQVWPRQGASRDSRIGETKTQQGPSEMQEGILRPGTDPHKTSPGKISPNCDELGTDDSLHPGVLQEQVPPVGVLHESGPHRLVKAPRNHAQKNHHGYSECRNTRSQDLAQRDCVHAEV